MIIQIDEKTLKYILTISIIGNIILILYDNANLAIINTLCLLTFIVFFLLEEKQRETKNADKKIKL